MNAPVPEILRHASNEASRIMEEWLVRIYAQNGHFNRWLPANDHVSPHPRGSATVSLGQKTFKRAGLLRAGWAHRHRS